jgi:rhodanese-related sulfurtransferase
MIRKTLPLMLIGALLAVPAMVRGADMGEKADMFLKAVPGNMMYLMSAKDLAAALDAGKVDLVVLDIRPPEHYNNGHIKNALHIPMTMIIEKMDKIPKDKKIAVVCAMDTNSAFAVAILRLYGYDAWIVEGGVPGWVKMGKPLVK